MDYTLLSCIDSRVESPMKFYGRFELGPFAPGQGLTVANSLRRSLLSQLTGTAIPLVQISGASHEYETLIGVRESVLDIILNIKQIILTSDFEFFSPQVGFLSVKGPGIVRARDLKLPNFIYAVDANQHIATLTTNGNLNMKFIIACGKNHITHSPGTIQYVDWVDLLKTTSPLPNITKPVSNSTSIQSANSEKTSSGSHLSQLNTNKYLSPPSAFYQQWKNERLLGSDLNQFGTDTNKKALSKMDLLPVDKLDQPDSTLFSSGNHKIGYFTIDATFMPVTRVNYLIQASDDLQLAKDSIILEVWTNGSIHPRHAIHKAAKALIQLFLPLQQMKNTGLNLNFGQVQLKCRQQQNDNSTANKNSSRTQSLTVSNRKSNTGLAKQNYQSDARILNLDIGNLDLTLVPYSLLKQANINTIGDLISHSKQQILEIPNFGQRWFNQIEHALVHLNLKLNPD